MCSTVQWPVRCINASNNRGILEIPNHNHDEQLKPLIDPITESSRARCCTITCAVNTLSTHRESPEWPSSPKRTAECGSLHRIWGVSWCQISASCEISGCMWRQRWCMKFWSRRFALVALSKHPKACGMRASDISCSYITCMTHTFYN